jgi:hypothetical protein
MQKPEYMIQVVSVTDYTKNTSKGYLNDYYVYLDGSQLDFIVTVSGRPDIEMRLDLPGQLLGFTWLFGQSASRPVRRRDRGISTDLNARSDIKCEEPAIFAFSFILAKV